MPTMIIWTHRTISSLFISRLFGVEISLSLFGGDLGGGVFTPSGCESGPLFASCPVETELIVSDSIQSKGRLLGNTDVDSCIMLLRFVTAAPVKAQEYLETLSSLMMTIRSYDKYLIYMDNDKTHRYTWSQFNFACANFWRFWYSTGVHKTSSSLPRLRLPFYREKR